MLRTIGFTGTIASGKTARCHHLLRVAQERQWGRAVSPADALKGALQVTADPTLEIGVKYINADAVGHDVYLPGKDCYHALIEHFGDKILSNTECDNHSQQPFINRRALGSIVFADPNELKQLNAICWPHIAAEVAALHTRLVEESLSSQRGLLLVVEAALLLDMADMLSHCTDLWVTSCTPAVAVTRVMQRNQLPRKDAEQRVASQGGLKEMTEKIRKSGFDRQCVSIFETDHVTLEEGLAEVEQAFQPYFDKHFHKP